MNNSKNAAPIQTGLPEGIFWGGLTTATIAALTGGAAFATAAVGATVAAVCGVLSTGAILADVAGVANGTKTVLEKRKEYEQGKVSAPVQTGLIEGVAWGALTTAAFSAATIAAGTGIAIITGVAPAAVATSGLITGIATAGTAIAGFAGIVNGTKTILEKREQYEATNHIQSSGLKLDGMLQNKSAKREHG